MFVQSFALRLKRVACAVRDRSLVPVLSPLAHALGQGPDARLAHAPTPPRALDWALLGSMAAAVALVAILCSAASRLGFSQVWRVGGWLP